MNAALLGKLFGHEQRWLGPCTVILDAEATVQALGTDAITGGGNKTYAPRSVSGRIAADAVCLLPDAAAILMLQQQKIRSTTGEERVNQTLVVADVAYVVAVEFQDVGMLANLGLTPPPTRLSGSQHSLSVKSTANSAQAS